MKKNQCSLRLKSDAFDIVVYVSAFNSIAIVVITIALLLIVSSIGDFSDVVIGSSKVEVFT